MLDATLKSWDDKRFGAIVSMRCIIKAAAMLKYGIEKSTEVKDLRTLLKKHDIVGPHEFFSSLLSQGVLLLNAALTVSSDGELTNTQHTKFWSPIVEKIVDAILSAKSKDKVRAVPFFCCFPLKFFSFCRATVGLCFVGGDPKQIRFVKWWKKLL